MSVEAGSENNGSILLTNEKKIPTRIEVALNDLSKQSGLAENDWLKLSHDFFELGPGEEAFLNYSIFLPSESTGEYSARIAFTEESLNSSSRQDSVLKARISVPFYATVKGTETYNLDIIDFAFDKVSKEEVSVTILNLGNVHIRPKGNCKIKLKTDDIILQKVEINKDGYPIKPGLKQKFKVTLERPLSSGSYLAELEFKPFAGHNLIVRKSFEFNSLPQD